ncbi:methyltransferase domain-containing protein [Egicoccus sp. AB-alg2]|uniref:methyltransferase domain-containing protein n=1 Tax=Egicoccus sp. AB-alg2 TaxID=3242693 RepID=UPI00359D8174
MTDQAARDLLFQDDVRAAVRSAYGGIPTGAGRAMAARLYAPEELALVPDAAIDWALGVGNPTRYAAIARGEVVLDVGCGGGIDSVLAARRVGDEGRVVGLDLLPEMRDRARRAAGDAGVADRCEFRVGEMEAIPLADDSVDVVVSNGVLNLSPRKSRALAEAARVLRPGGRLCIVDLAVDDDLPDEVLSSPAAWAGCIAGAVSQGVLAKKLANAGFDAIRIERLEAFGIDDVALYPLFTDDVLTMMRRLLAADAQVALSVLVQARMP